MPRDSLIYLYFKLGMSDFATTALLRHRKGFTPDYFLLTGNRLIGVEH